MKLYKITLKTIFGQFNRPDTISSLPIKTKHGKTFIYNSNPFYIAVEDLGILMANLTQDFINKIDKIELIEEDLIIFK